MIAAEARLLTYEEAGQRLGKGKDYIRERVKAGSLIGTDLGYNCKRISELDLQKFIQESRTTDRRRRKP
jgi:excisionase family DNA binding protein